MIAKLKSTYMQYLYLNLPACKHLKFVQNWKGVFKSQFKRTKKKNNNDIHVIFFASKGKSSSVLPLGWEKKL